MALPGLKTIALGLIVILLGAIALKAFSDTGVGRETVSIDVRSVGTVEVHDSRRLSVAVLGDPHVFEGADSLTNLKTKVNSVLDANPDLVLLVGDYTASPHDISDMAAHRGAIATVLGALAVLPNAAVLGNYETWSNPRAWIKELWRGTCRS